MPVASAAPLIPSFGKNPIPKISSGSSMILEIQPHKSANIVSFIRPTAWNIFSKARLIIITGANKNTILEYSNPSFITFSSFVNAPKNVGIIAMLMIRARNPCITERIIPWVAEAFAFSLLPAPRWNAIIALIPTPNPMAVAFTKFCTGKTSDRAVIACSLIWATKKLSTIL